MISVRGKDMTRDYTEEHQRRRERMAHRVRQHWGQIARQRREQLRRDTLGKILEVYLEVQRQVGWGWLDLTTYRMVPGSWTLRWYGRDGRGNRWACDYALDEVDVDRQGLGPAVIAREIAHRITMAVLHRKEDHGTVPQ